MTKTKFYYIIFVILLLLTQCKTNIEPNKEVDSKARIEVLRSKGDLRVVTNYNSTDYFIYRGQPMGYQYELLQELADYLQVKLTVTATNDIQKKFDLLEKNEVDLIAVNLTVTNERSKFIQFTEPHSQTRQVLVQQKPKNRSKLSEMLVTNQLDLAGKTIYVTRKSVYSKRLQNLSDEIGISIKVVETNESVEGLIEKVSKGQIKYTVCDENVALVNQTIYDNLDISLPVSFTQNLAWAVNIDDPGLKEIVDVWLMEFTKSKQYTSIYNKYYKNKRTAKMVGSEYFVVSSGAISPYDNVIKQFSNKIGWDWRLVASVIYQESRFNPDAKSWAGAYGLMQMMPTTAYRFGVDSASSPRQQIIAGVKFLQWLDKQYQDVPDSLERQKFVLASYNIGPGHIIDARNLAKKHGRDPNVWSGSLDEFLLKKSKPEYYNDPIVKYGYCRGVETFKYVAEVFERFEHYKNLIN